jgi:hypothetical protein
MTSASRIAVLLLAGAAACEAPVGDFPCRSDADCSSYAPVCNALQVCQAACTDADCPAPVSTCNGRECVDACTSDLECAVAGANHLAGQCSHDCPSGRACLTGGGVRGVCVLTDTSCASDRVLTTAVDDTGHAATFCAPSGVACVDSACTGLP